MPENFVKMLEKIRDLLCHNPNLILYGPPGTSKTYTAKGFAYFVINKDKEIPKSDCHDNNKNSKDEQDNSEIYKLYEDDEKWQNELEIYKLRERLHIFIVVDSNVVNKEITINKDDKDNFADGDFVLVYEGNGKAKIGKIKINGDKVKIEKIKKKNEPLTINNNDLKGKLENLKNTLGIWLVVKPSGVVAYNLKYEPDFYKLENPEEYDGIKPHDIFRWAIVQFHPAYNYDDFIYGIEPKTEGGQIQYNTVERVLVQMSKLAEENPDKEYVLIIDEINRANLPAVLGELIYALEYRGKEVNTLYGKTIRIPKNLYIIGTMNTADRSAGRIDYAIRRRFTFYPMHADSEQAEPNYGKPLMEAVNEFIENHISPEYDPEDVKIGHTYFMSKKEEDIAYKFIYQVVPLIYEYVQDGLIDLNKEPENKSQQNDIQIVVENKVIKIKKGKDELEIKGGKLVKNDKDVDIEEFKKFLTGEWTKLSYALADLIEQSFKVEGDINGWEKRKLEALKSSAVEHLKSLDDENGVLKGLLNILNEFSGYIKDDKLKLQEKEVKLNYRGEGKGHIFTLKLKENKIECEYKENNQTKKEELQSESDISKFLNFLENPKGNSQQQGQNKASNEQQETSQQQPQT